MANDNSKTQAQTIPLTKIHDLPGVFISKQPDKASLPASRREASRSR